MKTAAVVTVSDRCHRGERRDQSGPLLLRLLEAAGYRVEALLLVPDEVPEIERALLWCADRLGASLVVTTGGTGLSPRDVTPEATRKVCDRMVPGVPEAMRAACLEESPRAMLSRAACGVRGRALVLNLPGSPRAVAQCLPPVLPTLSHGIKVLQSMPKRAAK